MSAAVAPPVPWTLEGASRPALAIAGAARFVARRLEGVPAESGEILGRLAGNPLRLLAAAILALPVLRLLLPPAWATPAAALVAGGAALAILLAAGGALHAGTERRLVLGALLGGFLLRLAFAAAHEARGGFPDEYGYYDPIARDSADCWARGGPSLLATHAVVAGRATYFYLLTGVYELLGPALWVGRLLGALLGVLAALLAGEVARPLGGPRAAALAVVLLALHPEHASWSPTLSRDTLATVLLLATLTAAARPGAAALLAGVPLALLALNSFLPAGALAAALVVAWGARALAAGGNAAGRALRVAGIALLAVALLVAVGRSYGAFFTPELVAKVRTQPIGTVADFLPGLRFDSAWDLAAFLPVGASFVLLAPWPWAAAHGARTLYGLLALAGTAIALAGIAGGWRLLRARSGAAAPALLFVAFFLPLLALLEGTTGILVRHRLPLTAVLAVFAAVLLAGFREEPAR